MLAWNSPHPLRAAKAGWPGPSRDAVGRGGVRSRAECARVRGASGRSSRFQRALFCVYPSDAHSTGSSWRWLRPRARPRCQQLANPAQMASVDIPEDKTPGIREMPLVQRPEFSPLSEKELYLTPTPGPGVKPLCLACPRALCSLQAGDLPRGLCRNHMGAFRQCPRMACPQAGPAPRPVGSHRA